MMQRRPHSVRESTRASDGPEAPAYRTRLCVAPSLTNCLPSSRCRAQSEASRAVGGRALDDDEGVVSLVESACLDVSANARGLSVLALREAGREVSEAGLLAAAAESDVALSTLYLDAGVPVNCVDADGSTPLHVACCVDIIQRMTCHLALVTLLLDRGSTVIDEKDNSGHTPLHYSVMHGCVEVATLLLDRGSRAIDTCNLCGETPLHNLRGVATATLLLDRGSDAIDDKDLQGRRPLHSACRRGDVALARLFLDRGSTAIDAKDDRGERPLYDACRSGNVALVTLLLDRGSTAIDEQDENGDTPLHHACVAENLEVATRLLDRGCRFDVERYRSMVPYEQEFEELLYSRGYNVN